MVRILLSGSGGAMGKVIAACVERRGDCEIAAGIDANHTGPAGFPVFSKAADCIIPADVIIDFSHPTALEGLLAYAVEKEIPAVIATTGLSAEQENSVRKASESVAVFRSANMSLGINLAMELAKTAARVLGREFDIEIVEKHHNKKIDAPSGTALMLADAVGSVLENEPQYVYDRHSQRKKRAKNEIGLHAVRGGTIVGEHEIIFAGYDEVLTICHSAHSKEIFATGSINAALFLTRQKSGLYRMQDII